MDEQIAIGSGGVALAVAGRRRAWRLRLGRARPACSRTAFEIDALCGVSSGAHHRRPCWCRGWCAAARTARAPRCAGCGGASPTRIRSARSSMRRCSAGCGAGTCRATPLWQGVEATMRLFSPAQLNPFGHDPLRHLLDDMLDRRLLTASGRAAADRRRHRCGDRPGRAVRQRGDHRRHPARLDLPAIRLPRRWRSAAAPTGMAAIPATRRCSRC